MKKNIYSPDEFMSSLYGTFRAEPYKNAATKEDAIAVGKEIKDKAEELFSAISTGGCLPNVPEIVDFDNANEGRCCDER